MIEPSPQPCTALVLQGGGAMIIMASGALPPGLPPIMIDGEPYRDGGLVSNTPLLTFDLARGCI